MPSGAIETKKPAVSPRRAAIAHEGQAAQAHCAAAGKVTPATGPNQHWSVDFVHDQMHDRRKFRILTSTTRTRTSATGHAR
jgi:hypothetical protein